MTTAKNYRDQSVEELKAAYLDLSKELFKLKNERTVTRKVEQPHVARLLKKDRARVLTVLREKGERLS